jgi:hypothetical protein
MSYYFRDIFINWSLNNIQINEEKNEIEFELHPTKFIFGVK